MGKKILLIEDDDDIRQIYKEELDFAGFPTDAFATGQQGLKAFEDNTYALVALDIILPDINGLDILKQIRNHSAKKNTPVVLLTNLDQDLIIRKGFELGADDYLQKSANTPDTVIDKIKKVLEKTRQ